MKQSKLSNYTYSLNPSVLSFTRYFNVELEGLESQVHNVVKLCFVRCARGTEMHEPIMMKYKMQGK